LLERRAVLSVAASESLTAETDHGSPKILQSRIKKVKRAMHERKRGETLKPAAEPLRQLRKPIDLGNLEGYQRGALADLDQTCRRVAALQEGRHEAPLKAAALLGKYVHNGCSPRPTLRGPVQADQERAQQSHRTHPRSGASGARPS
jgi:hypothetical protein